jgi:hypothetical protein
MPLFHIPVANVSVDRVDFGALFATLQRLMKCSWYLGLSVGDGETSTLSHLMCERMSSLAFVHMMPMNVCAVGKSQTRSLITHLGVCHQDGTDSRKSGETAEPTWWLATEAMKTTARSGASFWPSWPAVDREGRVREQGY